MRSRSLVTLLAAAAAVALAACASSSSGQPGGHVHVSVSPDRQHPGRWCATAVDSRDPDAKHSFCQSPRGARAATEAVLAVDCPTRRVVLLGLAPGRLDAVRVVRSGTSRGAEVARRGADVTAFALATTVGAFPARLRTVSSSGRVRTSALRDPRAVCRAQPRITTVIDALHAA